MSVETPGVGVKLSASALKLEMLQVWSCSSISPAAFSWYTVWPAREGWAMRVGG